LHPRHNTIFAATPSPFLGLPCGPDEEVVTSSALYTTMRRALALAGRLGTRGGVVSPHELALYSVLCESQDVTGPHQFLEFTSGPVAAQDRARRSALAAAMLAYFGQNA